MDGLEDYLNKWSKVREDKYHMVLLICIILKNDTDKLIYKTETESQT